jgi:hypothetical protein
MLNHFLKFSDEPAALAALAAYVQDGAWDLSRVIPGQRVILARAEWDISDPDNPALVTPEQVLPGWYVTVSLPEVDVTLRELPDHACRLIGNSETGELVYTAPDLDAGLTATAIIEPVPAGARYSFA